MTEQQQKSGGNSSFGNGNRPADIQGEEGGDKRTSGPSKAAEHAPEKPAMVHGGIGSGDVHKP